jgi:uncharacterized protein
MASRMTLGAKRAVEEQRLAFVASVSPNGTPNVSPKGTIAVWDDDHLVFADIRSPGTVANISRNPWVNVVDPFSRKGYRFKGIAEIVRDGELFSKILDFYQARGSKRAAAARAFVLVKVERVQPLISPAYDDGSDEQSVRGRWIAYYDSLHRQKD